jgi:formylglycine-generating enzyme required for sulfatase activity
MWERWSALRFYGAQRLDEPLAKGFQPKPTVLDELKRLSADTAQSVAGAVKAVLQAYQKPHEAPVRHRWERTGLPAAIAVLLWRLTSCERSVPAAPQNPVSPDRYVTSPAAGSSVSPSEPRWSSPPPTGSGGTSSSDTSLASSRVTAAPVLSERSVGKPFRDCTDAICPEMVMIPPSRFQMGTRTYHQDHQVDESPDHEVSVACPFAVRSARSPVASGGNIWRPPTVAEVTAE